MYQNVLKKKRISTCFRIQTAERFAFSSLSEESGFSCLSDDDVELVDPARTHHVFHSRIDELEGRVCDEKS